MQVKHRSKVARCAQGFNSIWFVVVIILLLFLWQPLQRQSMPYAQHMQLLAAENGSTVLNLWFLGKAKLNGGFRNTAPKCTHQFACWRIALGTYIADDCCMKKVQCGMFRGRERERVA